jgi:hypothetical protein
MGQIPFLEQRQELVLRAIETAHAGVVLRPDNEVEGFKARFEAAAITAG